MNMKVENEMALPTTKSVAVMLLEPYAGKLARTVLRGESSRKGADLLDIVGSEPNIEFGAVAMDGVSFHQGGNTILGRTDGLPETTVGDDFGVLGL